MLRFAVNGELHSLDESAFDVELTLLQYLRNYTTLHVGTKLACGEGGCGACTVLLSELGCEAGAVSHRVVNACIFLVADANGRHVTTIEAVEDIAAAGSAGVGHAKSKSLHPLQQSLIDHHGSQCGYCTPGFVVAMLPRWIQCEQEMRHSLATEAGSPSIAEGTRGGKIKDIEDVLDGNLCRCTGYRSILQAFRHAFRTEFAKNDTSVEKKTAAAFAHFVSQAILPALTKLGELEITTGSEVAAIRGKALTASTSESSLFPGEYHHPKTVGDALRIAAAAKNFKFQAGATERKIEQLKIANKFQYPLTVISLIHVAELSSLSCFKITPSQEIVIPANLPLGEIEGRFREFLRENEGSENGFARQVVKAYLEMFRWFAGHQVRNVATFGGNLATASPIADLSPVTMAVGGSVKVARSQAKSGGTTSSADTQAEIKKIALPVDNSFFVAYRKTVLQPTDLLLSVHIPIEEDEDAGANSRQKMKFVRAYKASRRKEDDLSIVNGCFFVQLQKSSAAAPESPASYIVADCRFAFGGLAPFTRRCTVLEEHFLGKAFTSAEAFTEGLKLIEKFFPLPPDVPGGMSVFRKLLARSLFFKFWKEVGRELGVGATEDADGGALFLSEHHELRKQHSEPAHQHFAVDRLGEKTPAGSGATKHLAGHLHVTGKALYSYDQVAATGSCAAGAGGPMSKKKSEAALAQQGDAGVEVPWHPGTRDCMILDFVLSTKPHAKIDYIDFSKAEKVPGFIGVLTSEDLKFCKRVGPIVHDDDVFPVDNVVTHLGQICACVLAETREAARQCCMVTTIVWKEEYDFVLSIEEAIAQESFHDLLFTAEKTKVHQIWKQEAEETGLGRNGSTSSGTVVDRFFAGEIQDAGVALPDGDCDVPAEAPASDGENGAQPSETSATKNDKLLPDLSRLKSVLPPALVAPLPAAASTLPQGSTLAPVTLPGLRMSRPSTTHFGTSFAPQLRRTGSAQTSDHDYEQVSGEVYMGGQEHFYFETHSTAVELRSEEEVFVYSSTQNIAESQAFISEVCGLPQHKIHVKTTRLGGGFGGKETRACVFSVYPVLACQKFSRSTSTSRGGTHAQRRTKCKFIMERDTDSRTSGQRHSFVGQYKLLLDKRNKLIRAMDVKLFANAGVSHDLSNPVLDRGLLHVENCLSVPNVRVRGYLCKTNIPTNTAFRGFGGPQGLFVAEVMYQKAADVLGLGAKEELYEKMMYRGTTTAGGKAGGGASLELEKTFYNHAIGEWCPIRDMIVQLKAKCAFDARQRKVEEWNKRNKFVKRGIALMPTKYGISFTAKHLNQSGAQVNLYKDGSLLLHHGGHEMGQGVHTKVAAVAALMFDVPLSQIHIVETSTDAIPNTSPTAASAGSDLNGYACQIACAELLERLNSAKLLEKYGLTLVSDEATFVKPRTGNKSFARHRTSSLGEEVVGERVASKDGVGGGGNRSSSPPKKNDPGVEDTSSSDALFPPPTTGDHPGERIPFRRIDWSGSSAVTSAGSSKMEILGKIATDAWFARVNLCGRGFYATPISGVDWNKKGKNEFAGEPFYYYSWGVGVSEVELDTLTGDFQLLQTDLMHDVGRSLAPMVDIGQIEGAFTQGLGLFTSEEVVYLQSKQVSPGTGTSRRAAHFSVGPGFYKIPAVGNCPLRFETHLLENSRGPSVLGSKAIGEPPLFLACSVFFALREAMLSLVEDGAARVAIAKDLRLDSPLTAERLRIKCAQVLAMAGGSKDGATTERSLHEGLFDENGKWPEPCVSTAAKEGVINHWHARV